MAQPIFAILAFPHSSPSPFPAPFFAAIGYDAATDGGGPDGSITFEMDRGQNEGLKPALAVLTKVKGEMQSTNEVTFGDICAFAGAVAIESTGGPRIPVQLGR